MEKTAFVTGGGRGIGRAVVRRLAAEGCAVGINYLQSREAAEELAERGSGSFETIVSKKEWADGDKTKECV